MSPLVPWLLQCITVCFSSRLKQSLPALSAPKSFSPFLPALNLSIPQGNLPQSSVTSSLFAPHLRPSRLPKDEISCYGSGGGAFSPIVESQCIMLIAAMRHERPQDQPQLDRYRRVWSRKTCTVRIRDFMRTGTRILGQAEIASYANAILYRCKGVGRGGSAQIKGSGLVYLFTLGVDVGS